VATVTRRLQAFRYLHTCSGCYWLEQWPGGTYTHKKAPPLHGARRVEMWRGSVQRVAISVCRLVATIRCLSVLSVGFPVSTSPSSNPACLSQAPGFRTRHSRLRPRLLTPHCIQTYEPKGTVQVWEWIVPALALFRTVAGCATTDAAAARWALPISAVIATVRQTALACRSPDFRLRFCV